MQETLYNAILITELYIITALGYLDIELGYVIIRISALTKLIDSMQQSRLITNVIQIVISSAYLTHIP